MTSLNTDNTFAGCTGLKTVTLADSENSLSCGRNGFDDNVFDRAPIETLYLGRDVLGHPFKDGVCITSLTIGELVTSIYDEAFSDCTGLTELTIPN